MLSLYSKYVPQSFACKANRVLKAVGKLTYTKETLLCGGYTTFTTSRKYQETKGSCSVIGSDAH